MVIGRYEVVQKLGEGGMGTVFLAKDPVLDRSVAIKIISIRASGESEWLRSRFLKEAKVVALLNHPSIVSIFDLGEHSGQPYIVMEYVAGLSLYNLLKQRRLTSPEILGCVRSVATALDYAHSQHVIHRDIKPANLLIGNTGLKVTDFGVAKLATASDSTDTGVVVGTLAYMPPEQLKGAVQPQSDQYSLAAVTYELLVGKTVFQADTVAEMVFKICNEPLAPVNLACPEISDAVSKVLARSFSKDPANRFPTCLDFARALEQSIKQKGVTQSTQLSHLNPPAPPQISIPSFASESPGRSAKTLLVGIAVTICAALALFTLPRHQNPQPSIPQPNVPSQVSPYQPAVSYNASQPQVSTLTARTTDGIAKVKMPDPPKTSWIKQPFPASLRKALPGATPSATNVEAHQNAKLSPVNPEPTQSATADDHTSNTPADGRLVWTGTLDAGQQIDLGQSSNSGVVSGSLPGLPVNVEVHPSSIRIVTPPGPDNRWRKIVVQNDSTKRSIVVVRWSLIRR